jgi:pimeloyl-ACP methyl ester carboxylesterase
VGAGACSSGGDSDAADPPSADPGGGGAKEDFAKTFTVDGRQMYLECRGQGSPTVVLISGGGIAGDAWDSPLGEEPTVMPTVAKTTRVCTYDRPGTTRARAEGGASRSDPVPQPVTPSRAAADLEALLDVAGERGPFVLAAHSFGGLVARYFAHEHPDEVAGMVLVDSFSPELREAMGDQWAAWLAWNATPAEIIADYPEYEQVDFDASLDEIVANASIPPMPLVVLTADEPYPAPTRPGLPADIHTVTRRAQDVSQRQVAQLAPGARHITETDSGHDIMLENPVIVSDAILEVVEAVRDGQTSVTSTTRSLGERDFAGLVDVGAGRRIWATCRGQGAPTVVFISGKGNGAQDWSQILAPDDPIHDTPGDDLSVGMGTIEESDAAVFPSVARTTRVCAYDRPDIRTEGKVTTPRKRQPHTVDLDVDDLGALLPKIGGPGPYVLVAHSYGGLIATLYARTHPKQVAGMVMVDTASEVMADVVTPGALDWWDDVNQQTSDAVREGVKVKDAFGRINAAGPMPNVPAVVLVADKPYRTDLIPPDVLAGEHTTFEDWQAMVNRLGAQLGAKTITETNSGHNIYMYSPQLVIDAIDEVVAEVRAG